MHGLFVRGVKDSHRRDLANTANWLSFARMLHDRSQHITTVCQTPTMASQKQVQSCIWGISSGYFPLYHEAWLATKCRDVSFLRGCLNSPSGHPLGNYNSEVPCRVLFRVPSATTGSSSSLIDWCSLFVPPTAQHNIDRPNARKWVA